MKKWEREILEKSLQSRVDSLKKIYEINVRVEFAKAKASVGFAGGWWVQNVSLRKAITFVDGMGAGCASYLSEQLKGVGK